MSEELNQQNKSRENKGNTKKLNLEGNTNRLGEGHMYDKIMRENLEKLFLPLVADHLNLKIKNSERLADKQPTTIIRETDAFLLVETYSKEEPKFILHLEPACRQTGLKAKMMMKWFIECPNIMA